MNSSMVQYPAVRPSQPSTNQSYYARMQRSAERSNALEPRKPDVAQHPPNYSRSGRRSPHIAALSKQMVDNGNVPNNDCKYVAGPAIDDDNMIIDGNYYNGSQEGRGYSAHSEGHRSTPPKAKNDDTNRIRNILRRSSGNLASASQAPSMEALTAAIRKGLKPSDSVQRPAPVRTQTDSSIRIPFQEDPDSPSSTYTDLSASHTRPRSAPLSTYQEYDLRTIEEHEAEDHDRSMVDTDLPTPNSTNPIFASEHPGMSSRIPASKRPPKLDIGAVRDMEARGSVTSLPDLIKRATRLASNLDKGKTASRLGLLDFFGSNDKLVNHQNRDSSYSDVLDAFPTAGSPKDRPTTMWPTGQKHAISEPAQNTKTDPEKKTRRKCCGMSPLLFSLILCILFLLLAAAVLIPIFLIVLPREHAKTDPTKCPSSHPCLNGGLSVVANNVCSCICVDGFTGSDCSKEKDADCTTYTLNGGLRVLDNATIGSSVLSTFGVSQSVYNIRLNQTNLLAMFANANLSCTSENSLVEFASTTTVKSKRYVVLPGMMSTEPHVPALNLPASESRERKRFVIVDEAEGEMENLGRPTRVIHRRENTISTNGIVFATSTNAVSQATASTTKSGVAVPTTTANTTISGVADKQIDFAGVVVLYVLETFEQINVAVAANQAIASYFKATGHKNSTVEVVSGNERVDADFDKLQIVLANGTVLGGS